ncbi:hypothetical protein B0J18DRAFT_469523 [Chaetomium sp. MPI-SDFR-AT-0129]|nr:hypothetical protein B0J18DRAFT_469523 [Chaetomium sp. MPI-SDFR-AT-0129]
MAGLYLVPIPIAVPLVIFIVALIPLTPLTWVWVVCTGISHGIRDGTRPADVVKTIGRRVGLTVAVPWVAVIALCAMVVAQVVLIPFVFLHQLRAFRESLARAYEYFGEIQIQQARTVGDGDWVAHGPSTAGLEPYTFTPLPPTTRHQTPIRLLTLYPGSFNSPLRGTLLTASLSSHPPYDALSYCPDLPLSNPDANPHNDISTLFISNSQRSEAQQRRDDTDNKPSTSWQTLTLPHTLATALRHLRHTTTPRTIWVDMVCINGADLAEKSRQVGVRDSIFCGAREVIVSTGQDRGVAGEDGDDVAQLFEWVKGLGEDEVSSPLGGLDLRGKNLLGQVTTSQEWGVTGWARWAVGHKRQERVDQIIADLEVVWMKWGEKVRKLWKLVQEEYRVAVLGLAPIRPAAAPKDVSGTIRAFFRRDWFQQLWSLHDMALPELSRIRIAYGDKSISAERLIYLSQLAGRTERAQGCDFERICRWLGSQMVRNSGRLSLLNILIGTRELKYNDPRDKAFAALNIARRINNNESREPYTGLTIDYNKSVADVFGSLSAHLIQQYGPGFFFALNKSPPKIENLPSWAADWSVPWPNDRALSNVDPSVYSQVLDEKQETLEFTPDKDGRLVFSITRPRVVRGFFTRDGHIDDESRARIENCGHVLMRCPA